MTKCHQSKAVLCMLPAVISLGAGAGSGGSCNLSKQSMGREEAAGMRLHCCAPALWFHLSHGSMSFLSNSATQIYRKSNLSGFIWLQEVRKHMPRTYSRESVWKQMVRNRKSWLGTENLLFLPNPFSCHSPLVHSNEYRFLNGSSSNSLLILRCICKRTLNFLANRQRQ